LRISRMMAGFRCCSRSNPSLSAAVEGEISGTTHSAVLLALLATMAVWVQMAGWVPLPDHPPRDSVILTGTRVFHPVLAVLHHDHPITQIITTGIPHPAELPPPDPLKTSSRRFSAGNNLRIT
jgi:hypothetical protein